MKKNLVLAILFSYTSTFAQFIADSSINSIVRDSMGPEEVVPICATNLSYGTTFVSWFNQNSSASYDFSMQSVDLFGGLWLGTSGLTVSNYPQNSAIFTYDTKADNTNSMVTAFQDERSGVLDVVAYRMDASGTFQWGNAGVSLKDSAASGGIAPNVGIISSNDAVIAWIADGSPKDWISYQKISPNGTVAWSTPKRIIDSTGVAAYSRPQVIPLLNDEFMILYIEQTGSGLPASKMFIQRYDPNGDAMWPAPIQVSSKLIGFAAYPSVVHDGSGGVYVAYSSGNPSSSSLNDVFVQHVDGSGNLWSVDGTEACTGTATQRMSPKIRFESGMANATVLIKETDIAQGSSGVTIQSFDATGSRLLGASGFAVTPISAAYDEPYDMRASMNGELVILYAEGTFGNQQLLATKISPTGIPQWSPATTIVSSVASNKSRAQLTPEQSIIDGPNLMIAVWEDDRLDAGIYMQNINGDGTLGLQVGIESPDRNSVDATIFPNPSRTNQHLKITTQTPDKIVVRMYDATGRMIASSNSKQLLVGLNEFRLNDILNLSNISSGVYSIDVKGKKTSGMVKMVVE